MAFKFVFLRTPKPRRFNHKPIYWDPEKEEREQEIAEARQRAGQTPYQPTLKRGSFRRARFEVGDEHLADVRQARRQANLRFLIIAAVLLAIGVFFYFSSGEFLNL